MPDKPERVWVWTTAPGGPVWRVGPCHEADVEYVRADIHGEMIDALAEEIERLRRDIATSRREAREEALREAAARIRGLIPVAAALRAEAKPGSAEFRTYNEVLGALDQVAVLVADLATRATPPERAPDEETRHG